MLTFEAIDELLRVSDNAACEVAATGQHGLARDIRAARERVKRELEGERCVLTTVNGDSSGL